MQMTLSAAILEQKLRQPFRYFQRVASTNDLAKAWLMEGAPAGAVVVADEQVSGRGRNGRVWRTPPNAALAISVILLPPAAHIARVNMIGASERLRPCHARWLRKYRHQVAQRHSSSRPKDQRHPG